MHSGRDPMKYVFQNTVSGHALLVRREMFDACLPFPEMLYHDWWLAMRAAAGNGVVYVDQPLVQFRRHDSAFRRWARRKCRRAGNARPSGSERCRRPKRAVDYWPGSPDRKWVEERMYLFHAFGQTDWRGSDEARAWESAMQAAMAA
jgi:hypothetical protein